MTWFNNDCVRRAVAAEVISLGIETDPDFEKALYQGIREAFMDFNWRDYGLDYVAETIGDAEEWMDALGSEVFYAVKYTTESWKEKQ
jgi:hypothetical protein